MARPRSNDRPRTPRTDSNGRILDEYNTAFEQNAINEARSAGIPEDLLHQNGWNGSEESVTGYWSDLVYRMSDFLSTLQRDTTRIQSEVISPMVQLCKSLDVEPRAAMESVFSAARLLRSMGASRDGISAAAEDFDLDMFGGPFGPDHDSHGHGLSNGAWTCFSE